ncbi:MAG TPA: polysaccharide biosynthesis tyrosine autokinase [Verrucomicrobiae bacterium]|nr:polysaccharide biosynthesis tyrosine autokinase [Verrucomicrobiae bacterium]
MNPNSLSAHSEQRELSSRLAMPVPVPPRALPAMEGSFANGQEYVSLSTYWHTLMKRRWTIATVALVITTLVAVVSFKMQPVYKATARVQVESETPMVQSIEEVFQKTSADDTYLQTQIQVLESETLAWRTIEELRLREHLISPSKLSKIPEEKQKVRLIEAFKRRLSVELTPKTRMLAVSFEDPDPQLAARVATTLVNNYIDYNFRQKYDATRQASAWMEQQLDELKAKVESSQQALVEYEREHQLVNTGEKETVQEQILSELSKDQTAAESDRLQKESLYHEVEINRAQLATLVHNDLLQKLEEKLADLRDQYTETVAQYGPKFPKAIRLDEEIQDLRGQILAEQERVLARIRKDYTAAVTRERLASGAVAQQKEAVGAQNQLLVQHNILAREFESNQQLYQSLLERLKNATVSAGLQSTNIHMVDAALPPSEPVRPRKSLNIALGLLAGIVLGTMTAFAQEGMDHSVKSAEEVEQLLMTPALAVVPLHRGSESANRKMMGAKFQRSLKDPSEKLPRETNVALAIIANPQSTLAEAYRTLRTSVLLSLAPNPPKSILITSSQAGEGKTATALNLAQTLAQRKGKVVIVDCDLRKGGIARILRIDNEKGVSTVLTGADKLTDALQQFEESNLWILPSGPVPPNPAELVGSDRMADICTELSKNFEHIVIDSPPVLAVTDATIMAGLVDGVVLIAESGRTHRAGLMRTRAILENAGARILGVVLNKMDLRRDGYGYGYGNYYYAQYGKYPYGRSGSE